MVSSELRIQSASSIEIGETRELFCVGLPTVPGKVFDVSRDGQRILVAKPTGNDPNTLAVVLNWTSHIGKR